MLEQSEASREGMWRRMLTAVVIAGVALRVAQWLAGHPIWHDEWFLVRNVEQKTALQLMGALEMNQGAPPLFLLSLRGLFKAFGESQVALRIPSVIAGSLALVFVALVAWRMFRGAPAVLATAGMALSDRMIWHSAEIKPYAIDVWVASAITWAAIALAGNRRLILLGALAAAGMWASYTTAFVFAGVMLALLPAVARERRGWMGWLACVLVGGASFVAAYFLVARHQHTPSLALSWANDYLPWARPWKIPLWLGRETVALASYASNGLGLVILPLAAGGAVAWWRNGRRSEIGILAGPILVVLFASAAAQYPFGGSRATLFLMPGVFLLAGAGLESLGASANRQVARLWWVPGAVVVAVMVVPAAYHLAVPRVRSAGIKPLARYVDQHRQPGDLIYVIGEDGPDEFLSYWGKRGGITIPCRKGEEWPRPKAAQGRFWIVGTYQSKSQFKTWEHELNPDAFKAPERDRLEVRDGAAVLYDPSEPATKAGVPRHSLGLKSRTECEGFAR